MAECFALPEEEWEDAVERLAAAHPEQADEIRERFETVRLLNRADAPAEGDPFPERLGEFQLLDRLGGGGMGVVFRARQTSLDREVALKLVRPEHLYFRGSRERFRREVEAIAQLQHSGIIAIHTVGEESGLPYFAMELLGGPTLSEVLADLSNRAPESLTGRDLWRAVVGEERAEDEPPALFRGAYVDACLEVARQVAEALAHAHGRGILHRDVKPSNVALRPDGRAVLFDFGLTSSARDDAVGRRVTRTGTLLGTLAYMSPEQVQGRGELDERTDVYSLGVTLYELLTLHLPFGGRNTLQVQARILAGAADSMRARNRRVPEDAETVCRTAMALRAQDRYASADALARDLANVLARHPIAARPPGAAVRALRWCQRNAAAAVAIALGVLLLVGLPSGLLVQQRRHAAELRRALEREQAARSSSNRALEGERGARREADAALRREQDALVAANAALAREQTAREETRAALDDERAARADAALARDEATARLEETEAVLAFVVSLFEAATPEATRGQERSARDVVDAGARRVRTALRDRPRTRARLLQTIAQVYVELQEYGRARPLLEEAAGMWRGHDDRDAQAHLAATLASLGDALAWSGELDAAERTLEESLELGRAALGPDDPRLFGPLRALADTLMLRNHVEEALPLREEALALVRADPGATPKDLAIALGALGSCHQQLQEPELADGPLTESLEIFRRDVGGPDPGYASTLSNLGSLRLDQGRFEEAEELFEEALVMFLALFGDEQNHNAVTARANLGAVKLRRGRETGDAALLEEALEITRAAVEGFGEVLAPEHPRTLVVRSSEALILLDLERPADARAVYDELIPLYRASFGEGDIYTASGHLWRAECHTRLGDPEAAADDLARALSIMEPLSNFDPMKVHAHYLMGRAQLALGEREEAEEQFRRGLAFEDVVPDARHLQAIREELARLEAVD